MTDIVERLRFKKELKTPEDVHVLFADAADEIERLRGALREFVWLWPRPYPSAPEDMMYQQACIDKARAALGEKESG